MCALKRCAAAGARTNPIATLVVTASGTLSVGGIDVLNRISERTGARAVPKKKCCVDMRCEGLSAESRVSVNAENDGPDVDEVLAEEAESQNQEQTGD